MIKAIIFDFDGVLVESTQIKTEAFRNLFSKWPDKVDEIVKYHLSNMGISRYVKFKYFYENILGELYSEEKGMELGRRFSELVLDEIKKAPFVKGVKEFLEKYYQKYMFFIASGTPQSELFEIVTFKGLAEYINDVIGTPVTKIEIIETILKMYSLERHQVVFVGDAESDKIAAERAGIPFIARLTDDNTYLNNQEWNIKDMTEFEHVIQKIDNVNTGVDVWKK